MGDPSKIKSRDLLLAMVRPLIESWWPFISTARKIPATAWLNLKIMQSLLLCIGILEWRFAMVVNPSP